MQEHVETVEKAVMEYGVPYYEKYMPFILETVDGQVRLSLRCVQVCVEVHARAHRHTHPSLSLVCKRVCASHSASLCAC